MFSEWAFEDAGRRCPGPARARRTFHVDENVVLTENKKHNFLCLIQSIRNYDGFFYQIEVTSKLKSLSNQNIASDMLAFTRATKELDFNRDPKGIRRDSEAFIMDFTSIPRKFIWIPGP